MCQVRFCARQGKPVALTQCAPDHAHQVKNHANTGQRLAGKLVTMAIGIDDSIGCRQYFTRKVMVGDDDLATQLTGPVYTFI